MKNPPTLADAVIKLALDTAKHHEPAAGFFKRVASARKFVLDEDMSEFLTDLAMAMLASGRRSIMVRAVEDARRASRLPHALTWIEFDDQARHRRGAEAYGHVARDETDGRAKLLRRGWLLEQHPLIDTAFRGTEFGLEEGDISAGFLPYSFGWCCDDGPIPWKPMPFALKRPRTDAQILLGASGYESEQVKFVEGPPISISEDELKKEVTPEQSGPIARYVWALLSAINDIPIKLEEVRASKGYISRGRYRRFVDHSVVHLTVPQRVWRVVARKAVAAVRRRAHQVRGFWRKDWRHPLRVGCEHEFNDGMLCQHCGGHKIWVHEHQRGDASLGFVLHDYDVSHVNE